MSLELPPDARALSAWLATASDAEVEKLILEQLAENPEQVRELSAELGDLGVAAWQADVPLGQSVVNEADYVEIPLDYDEFLQTVLPKEHVESAVVRLNVRPEEAGSRLEVDVVLPRPARPGLRVTVQYDLDGEDAVLVQPVNDATRLTAVSHTSQQLGADDAVRLRLVVEEDGDAVA